MNKYLLGTTALTTAGLIAGMAGGASAANQGDNRIKVGVHGYHQQWGVYANQDIDSKATPGGASNRFKTNAVDQKHNSEICFTGETTLDNGITFGINVQLEANTESDQIDESFLYVQSDSMGRLILGDENNAGFLLHVTAPDGGISIDSGDMTNDLFWENLSGFSYFDTSLATTNLRFGDNDSGKFTYISPRFAGFQLGASYIPQFESGGDNNSSVYKSRVAGTNTINRTRNGVAVGGNFTEDFNGFGVKLSLGWLGAQTSDNDLSAANAGAQFSYAGLTVGGAYVKAFDGTQSVDATGNELRTAKGYGWTVGGAYEIGPYTVGLTYQYGENDGNRGSSGKPQLQQANISGTYQFGPGVDLVGGFFAYDLQTQGRSDGTVGFDNQGWGFASGIKLAF
jgi:predicted porin